MRDRSNAALTNGRETGIRLAAITPKKKRKG